VFSALGNAGINIIAISQGSSERNISLVVTDRDAGEAVRAIHRAFRLETTS
jgi:aspartokinase